MNYKSFVTSWLVLAVLSALLSNNLVQAQTLVTSAEAENGTRAGGVTVSTAVSGYSGTGYVTNFTSSADKVTVTMNVPEKNFYKLVIRYRSNDYKEQYVQVNSGTSFTVKLQPSATFTDADAGKVLLNAGNNTITLQSYWGWSDIDKFSLYSTPKNTYDIAADLVNTNSTAETRALYDYLRSRFGTKIISGQTSDYYDSIKILSGKSPMLRGFDFQHYTRGYAYNWANGGFAFGWHDSRETENAINWYNQTGKRGIVSIQWHWHSPTGGQVGKNTFYTQYTTFDASKAVVPGNQEYTDVIRDIDSIASQLKKFLKAGVPVIFRPLHEASGNGAVNGSGAWFWWGAKGAGVCRKLYGIIYDRIANHHGINNLIWTWSSPEAEWYPGNDSIDIAGHDSYPGAYNYDVKKNDFDVLYTLTGGKKLIAMTENGPIPDPANCLALDAPWSFFMSWSNMARSQNSKQQLVDVHNNGDVLILEPLKPQKPSGTDQLDINPADQNYTTRKVSEASSYVWKIMPANAGTLAGTDTVVTINFSNTFTGKAKLIVSGQNSFGIGQPSDTLTISIGSTVNINEAKDTEQVQIFPNPSSGKIKIKLNSDVTKCYVEIVNNKGSVVYQEDKINENEYITLNLSTIPAGVYFIRIRDKEFNTLQKLVISR